MPVGGVIHSAVAKTLHRRLPVFASIRDSEKYAIIARCTREYAKSLHEVKSGRGETGGGDDATIDVKKEVLPKTR